MSDQYIIIRADTQRIVCRVAIIAFEENMCCLRLGPHQVHQGKKRNAFPFHIKLTPSRHTMKVADILELWQIKELFPVQHDRGLYMAMNLQLPLVERNLWLNTKVKYRKVLNLPLTRWQTVH